MAGFNFDEVDQFVQQSDNKINFLKLQDDGWYAKVRFMFGPGECFRGETVHNISEDPRKPKYVPCLRQSPNQPLDVCPLCANGSKITVQFFIPIYVHSIVSNVRGVEQEQPVNQVMLFQKGTSFKAAIQSVLRQTARTGKPIVNSVFNLVRNGKAGDMQTSYTVEYVSTDDVTLEQLPPRIEVLGSYILPSVDYNTMLEKYVNKTEINNVNTVPDIQPRTINANTFAGNTVVGGSNFVPPVNNSSINANQAPNQAPNISSVPF